MRSIWTVLTFTALVVGCGQPAKDGNLGGGGVAGYWSSQNSRGSCDSSGRLGVGTLRIQRDGMVYERLSKKSSYSYIGEVNQLGQFTPTTSYYNKLSKAYIQNPAGIPAGVLVSFVYDAGATQGQTLTVEISASYAAGGPISGQPQIVPVASEVYFKTSEESANSVTMMDDCGSQP